MRRSILSVRTQRVLLAAIGAASVMSCGITWAADVPAAQPEDAATAGSPPAPQAAGDTGGLAEVVVTGQRAAIRRAQDIKLNSISVVDAVSAEEAGKFPDQNVADALQRVPGVAVDRSGGESSQITVRGLGPDFVNVVLNGRTLATDAKDRAFQFDVLPSELISTAEVHKTSSADLEEGGIGGTVNIITARPLDSPGFHASGSLAAVNNSIDHAFSGKTTPKASLLFGDSNDDHTFGWLVSGMYYKRDDQRQIVDTSGWYTNVNQPQLPAVSNFSVPQTLALELTHETRTRQGLSAAIDWLPIDKLKVTLDGMFSNYRVASHYNSFGSYGNAGDIQAITVDPNGTALSYTRTNTGNLANDYIQESNPRNAYNVQGGLNVAYAFTDSTKLDWDSALSSAWNKAGGDGYFLVVGTRNFGVNPQWTNNGSDSLPSYSNLISTTNTSDLRVHCCNQGGQSPNVEDKIQENRLHLSTRFDGDGLSKLDFGLEYTNRVKREYNVGTLNNLLCAEYCGYIASVPASAIGAYVFNAGTLVKGVSPGAPTQWLGYNPYAYLNYLTTPAAYNQLPNPAAFAAALAAAGGNFAGGQDLNSFSEVHERTRSAYAKADFTGHVFDKAWFLDVGVRYSHTDTTSNAYSSPLLAITINPNDTSNAIPTYGSLSPISDSGGYGEWLPSANFKLNLRDDLLFRLALSKTESRPDLSNLSAATVYGFRPNDQTLTVGNVNLKPYTSNNFDSGLEWYLDSLSYIAVDGFYKRVSNFNTTILTQTTVLGFPFQLIEPVNLNTATIGGEEFTVNYQFTRLPKPFDGLGAAVNYTHVSSNASINPALLATGKFAVPGIGDSGNVSGYYEEGPWQLRLAYNWRGKYLWSIADPNEAGQPTTTKAYGQLDFSGSFAIRPNLSVFLTATNLLRETIFKYQVYPNRPTYAEADGGTVTLGIRGSL
ncbi:MAG TPA: TonB-dependent receptor [Steroidobacteraceae bacterium]|nr:TonB-dependent receptor [Steroidobacteraceae bacterium]